MWYVLCFSGIAFLVGMGGIATCDALGNRELLNGFFAPLAITGFGLFHFVGWILGTRMKTPIHITSLVSILGIGVARHTVATPKERPYLYWALTWLSIAFGGSVAAFGIWLLITGGAFLKGLAEP